MSQNQPDSTVPILGEGFQDNAPTTGSNVTPSVEEAPDSESKGGKRRFWGLGKRKEDEKARKKRESAQTSAPSAGLSGSTSGMTDATAQKPVALPSALSKATPYPYSPSSPSHNLRSSSPAPPSPASSQIFERNVQEDTLAITEKSPIPGHITTENHIPPVLDASSEAITNDQLSPDNVEIVMHSAHQPASLTVTGLGSSEAVGSSLPDDMSNHPESEDGTSNYGTLDASDVRRLSFISFADVVNAEHNHDASSIAPSISSPVFSQNRSPSPIRSPLSSQGLGGSPDLAGSASSKGLETSPNRLSKAMASTLPGHSPPTGGELTIETMRQALRKTGSGDLSGARSAPLSAIGDNEGSIEHPFK